MSISISLRTAHAAALIDSAAPALGCGGQHELAQLPEVDFVTADYRFTSGETLAELKPHYRTLGTASAMPPARSSTVCCCCRAIPEPAPTGCGRASPTSCSSRGQPLHAGRYFI